MSKPDVTELFFRGQDLNQDDINANKNIGSVDCFIAVHQDPKSISMFHVKHIGKYKQSVIKKQQALYAECTELFKQLNPEKKTYSKDLFIYNQKNMTLNNLNIEVADLNKYFPEQEVSINEETHI